MTAETMAKAALLVLLVVQVLSVVAAAGRPLPRHGIDVLLEDRTGMMTQILGAAKSGPNPPSHCCN